MRNLFLTPFILMILSCIGYSQTTQDNMNKYWKFRNTFRKDFIKIGRQVGESISMWRREPWRSCVDMEPNSGEQPNNGGGNFSTLMWGDGMIIHGHYLGLLATEYALLKKNGNNPTKTSIFPLLFIYC